MAEYISFQPSDYFNSVLYTGTGAVQTISGVGFEPDLTWCKDRTNSYDQVWFDQVRGATERLTSNTNTAESTQVNDLTAWNSDGFVVGSGSNINNNTNLFVGWNWKAGTTTGLSGGTITPTSYSINTTSGFGVYKYTGTGSAGTIAHGLGVAPEMVIVKKYNTTADWYVYHKDMPSGNGYHMTLNTNAAEASGTEWNSTDPTSTVFSLGANSNTNASGATFIAYVFAPVKGYSHFGSYTGSNTVDGSFVYTGFRPAFVMCKYAGGAGYDWVINDDKRRLSNNFPSVPPNISSKKPPLLAAFLAFFSYSFCIFSSNSSNFFASAFFILPVSVLVS